MQRVDDVPVGVFCMWGWRIFQTDTASVLLEAIGYIKFLQNQVEVISIPNVLVEIFYVPFWHIAFSTSYFYLKNLTTAGQINQPNPFSQI